MNSQNTIFGRRDRPHKKHRSGLIQAVELSFLLLKPY